MFGWSSLRMPNSRSPGRTSQGGAYSGWYTSGMPSRAEDFYRALEKLSEVERTSRVEGWISHGQTEDEFLDFKTGKGNTDKHKETWSKLLSAFANTEGGVLVWGLSARTPKQPDAFGRRLDRVDAMTPVDDPSVLEQTLKDVQLAATIEPVRGVEFLRVPASSAFGGPRKGYLLCLVPEGNNKPYRAELESGRQYWQRVGGNSVVLSHTLLRSLFYPQRHVSFQVTANLAGTNKIGFHLHNVGMSSAENVAVRLKYPNAKMQHQNAHGWQVIKVTGEAAGSNVATWERQGSIHPQQDVPLFTITVKEGQAGLEPVFLDVLVHSKDNLPVGFVFIPCLPTPGQTLKYAPSIKGGAPSHELLDRKPA
jgi:hypothetical protein